MFHLITGGVDTYHPGPYTLSRPNGLARYVLLLTGSRTTFTVNGRLHQAPAPSMMLITPLTPYVNHSTEHGYRDDWIHFTCDDGDMQRYQSITTNQPVRLTNPAMLRPVVQQLLWEHSYGLADCRDTNTDLLLRVLLNTIAAVCADTASEPYHPWRARLQRLRIDMRSQPWQAYSAASLAAKLGISASYFQHLYTELFGVSFQADLIEARVAYAKELLAGTDMTMAQIAHAAGYATEVHFYRQFRKLTQLTPADWRAATASGAGPSNIGGPSTGAPAAGKHGTEA